MLMPSDLPPPSLPMHEVTAAAKVAFLRGAAALRQPHQRYAPDPSGGPGDTPRRDSATPGPSSRSRLLAALATLLCAAPACTVIVPGTARPLSQQAVVDMTKQLVSTRPKAIPMDGLTPKDACALPTREQLQQLAIDTVQPRQVPDQFGNHGCFLAHLLGSSNFMASITPTPQEGAYEWILPGASILRTKVVIIAGFSAVRVQRLSDVRTCMVSISATDEQSLRVTYEHVSEPIPYTPEQICDRAQQIATFAAEGLLRRPGPP